jgi:hypothetical protein
VPIPISFSRPCGSLNRAIWAENVAASPMTTTRPFP